MVSLTHLLLLATIAVSMALPRDVSQNLIDSHLRTLMENRQTLKLLRDAIDEMDSNIEAVQKRSVCYIGGGMGHNCEYGEALDLAAAARHLLAEDTPGKRSRSRSRSRAGPRPRPRTFL